jgi:hypothetical protein
LIAHSGGVGNARYQKIVMGTTIGKFFLFDLESVFNDGVNCKLSLFSLFKDEEELQDSSNYGFNTSSPINTIDLIVLTKFKKEEEVIKIQELPLPSDDEPEPETGLKYFLVIGYQSSVYFGYICDSEYKSLSSPRLFDSEVLKVLIPPSGSVEEKECSVGKISIDGITDLNNGYVVKNAIVVVLTRLSISLYDICNDKILLQLNIPNVTSVCFSRDSKQLFFARGNLIYIYHIKL